MVEATQVTHMVYTLGKDSPWGGSQSDGRVLGGLCRCLALEQHLHHSCKWEGRRKGDSLKIPAAGHTGTRLFGT